MPAAARQRMRSRLAQMPATRNSYALEEFGLDAGELCERFRFYVECFDVRRESASSPDFTRMPAVAAA
jgi:hypothetical protein